MKKLTLFTSLALLLIVSVLTFSHNVLGQSNFTLDSVSASSIEDDSAKISWFARNEVVSQIQYGTTTNYIYNTQFTSFPATSNTLTISGLNEETLYHYRLVFRDASGNLYASGDGMFSTRNSSSPNTSGGQPTIINIPPRSGTQISPIPVSSQNNQQSNQQGSNSLNLPSSGTTNPQAGTFNTNTTDIPPKLDYSGFVKCDGVISKNEPDRKRKCDFAALMETIIKFINWLFYIGLAIATALFAYGGLLYITGQKGKIDQAKKIFTSVAIGFIIMLVAWLGVYTAVSWLVKANFGATSLLEAKK